MKSRMVEAIIFLFVCAAPASEQPSRRSEGMQKQASHVPDESSHVALSPDQNRELWGDQGDGTYSNPIMPGDFSDIDAIRVGSDFYAISSTMQFAPGMAVLHSRDLINWKIVGHVVPDLTVIDPELNWDRMDRAGRGIWAGAIRHHAGRFWVYFGTPDQGIFLSQARNPSGPWTQARLVLRGAGWDDPCPFWDEDGKAYLVTSHFAPEEPTGTRYNIHLFRMTVPGDRVLEDSDSIIHRSQGSEANKLYRIHGIYYHLFSEVRHEGRVIMMERSRSLQGPWEIRQLIHVDPAVDKEPNQGGLVELRSHEWYFVSHQGRGDWEGRAGVLLPVTWIDGWPVIGAVGPDGIGHMVWRGEKPVLGDPETVLAASDSFDSSTLKPEWEWNYQPRAGMWSLKERPGYLRLRAFEPLRLGDFKAVGDVITQRAFRTRRNQATIKMDLSGMAEGQEAGLAHFARTYGTIGIVQQAGSRRLVFHNDGITLLGPEVDGVVIYLRSTWGFDGDSQFWYSSDGVTYHPFGERYDLTWGAYRGDRIGIYTFSGTRRSGYVDIDSFTYRIEH